MIKVLHFSDVHVEEGFDGVPMSAFANKRAAGFLNLALRRRRLFKNARTKLGMLAQFAREEGVHLALCTGDYTALGTEPELIAARSAIEGLTSFPLGYVTVKGNHDVYMPDALGRFERHFSEFLKGDFETDSGVRVHLCGEQVAVVCVNSARPNPSLRVSSGRIPQSQLRDLSDVFADERLKERFVFVATHYAPRLANGEPDHAAHGLENADAFLQECKTLEFGAIVHGHVHHSYVVREPGLSVPLCGAGSATQERREHFHLYCIDGKDVTVRRGHYASDRGYFLGSSESLHESAR